MSKFEANAITWFEIPVSDIDRARGFYEKLLSSQDDSVSGGEPCFIFPTKDSGVGRLHRSARSDEAGSRRHHHLPQR